MASTIEPIEEVIPPTPELSEKGERRRRSRSGRSRHPVAKMWRKFRKRRYGRTIVIGLFVALVVVALSVSILIVDASSQLNSSWQSLSRVLTTVNNRDGTQLTLADFRRLEKSLGDVSSRLSTTASRASLVAPLADLHVDARATLQLIDVANHLVRAGQNMLQGVQPAITFMVDAQEDEAVGARISSGERIVELLELGRGRFLSANEQLTLATQALDNISAANLSAQLLLNVEQLYDYQRELASINAVLLDAPDLLTAVMGLGESRNYLILAQNNDEIRPSGGFIGTYGWMVVRNGRIISYDYSPVTATNPNPPPASFVDTFEIPDWWIRFRNPIYAAWDGSWHADFSETARLAMAYYNAGGNPSTPIHGVIAIDIDGFEIILRALGEIRIPNYGRTVNADNFRNVVYDIRAFGRGVNPHKEFISDVYKEIFTRWQSVDQTQSPDLLGAILEALQRKHIMIYFADETVNNALTLLGWNGQQVDAIEHDYLLIADANLGNKSNNSVIRHVTYDVRVNRDGTLDSRMSVRYDYFDDVARLDPAVDAEFHGPLNYRNLMQIFVPRGTELIDTSNINVLRNLELDAHQLLVARTEVVYDTSERYQFTYQTPPLIDTIGEYQRYRLLVQKQPGSRTQAVNVTVTLSEGSRVVTTSPQVTASYSLEQPVLDFRLELDRDRWIEIIFE